MRSTKTPWQATVFAVLTLSSASSVADAGFYNSLRLSLIGEKSDDPTQWSVRDSDSRLGFRAVKNLEGGLRAVAHIEVGLAAEELTRDGDTKTRLANVGLEGRFGSVYLGKQWSPFYNIIGATTDLFNTVGAEHIYSTTRLDNMLSYIKNYSHAVLQIGAVIDDYSSNSSTDDEMLDLFQLGAKFNIGPVSVGAALDNRSKSTGDGVRLGLAATYKLDEITIAAEFTSTEGSILGLENDLNAVELYAGFGLGYGRLLQTSIGQTDNGTSTSKAISVGYQKKLSRKTMFWLEAMFEDSDNDAIENTNTFVFGLRNDWH